IAIGVVRTIPRSFARIKVLHSIVLMIEYVFFISNLMSQLHIAPLFIFCLVLNDYHNALSVSGLIIYCCFIIVVLLCGFLCFCGVFIYLSAMPLEAYKRK
ncbi:hypothetical protein, partial [Escherichia coli]